MKTLTSMRRALTDPALFAPLLPGDTWDVWRVMLIAAMGEALREDERPIFQRLTGREKEPLERVECFVAIVWASRRQITRYGRPGRLHRGIMRP